jgi:multidrug efflux pump subunit AcrA (membrane-fusion protein)
VIHDGQVLYRVDQAPVVLLYGSIPAYRTLAEGVTAEADVAQLNHDLVALGYVDRSEVDAAWDEFNWATRLGVEKLQAHLRVGLTGRLGLGDVVFLPTAARVTTLQASLGGPATGPVLSAKVGDRVTITMPDGRTIPGTVTSVGRVATVHSNNAGGSDTGPTVTVHIRPIDPNVTGGLDQAQVEVSITDRTVHNVLAVPVTALLARSGGYAVEVIADDGVHQLVRVRPRLFDDAVGMVQVSGAGLAAGQRVVVPGDE